MTAPAGGGLVEAHHELKTWPSFFRAVWDRKKRFEVRENDRGFKAGQAANLREWAPGQGYSGREVLVEITFVLEGGAWGIASGTCVFSFHEISRVDHSAERVIRELRARNGD